jgi:hypothetical protein
MILVLHLATHLNFKHCQVRRQRPYLNDLLPGNDGVDDFLKSLDIPDVKLFSPFLTPVKLNKEK